MFLFSGYVYSVSDKLKWFTKMKDINFKSNVRDIFVNIYVIREYVNKQSQREVLGQAHAL